MVKSTFGKSFEDKSQEHPNKSPARLAESKETEVVMEANEDDEEDYDNNRLKNYTMMVKDDKNDQDIERNKRGFNKQKSDKDISMERL